MTTTTSPQAKSKKKDAPARSIRHNLRTSASATRSRPVRPVKPHPVDTLTQFGGTLHEDVMREFLDFKGLLKSILSDRTSPSTTAGRAEDRDFEPCVKSPGRASSIDLANRASDKRPLLAEAITTVHDKLNHQSGIIEKLRAQLEGVLMPSTPTPDHSAAMTTRPLAPPAVNGVFEAADRLELHTEWLLDLLRRLEA
jgi:hypothetical protein